MQTHSRSRKLLHPEKFPIADKHKPSQIRSITPRASPSVITPPQTFQPLRNTGKLSKPLTQFQHPSLPVSLVRQPTLAHTSPPAGFTTKID